MKIVLCSDYNYLRQCLITCISAIENSRESISEIVLVGDFYSKDNLQLCKRINEYYNSNIISTINLNYEALRELLRDNKYGKSPQGQPFAFAKLVLPKIITDSRFLYLDSDTLVLKSLDYLDNLSINCCGAVLNINDYNMESTLHPKLLDGRPRNNITGPYYNSGVLLINRDFWVNNKITEQILNKAIEEPDILCDQDALNKILSKEITDLPLDYNFKTNFWFNPVLKNKILQEKICSIDTFHDPSILHYATKQKPWKTVGWVGPYKTYHDKFLDIVGPRYSLKNIIPNKHRNIDLEALDPDIRNRVVNYSLPEMKCLNGLDEFNC